MLHGISMTLEGGDRVWVCLILTLNTQNNSSCFSPKFLLFNVLLLATRADIPLSDNIPLTWYDTGSPMGLPISIIWGASVKLHNPRASTHPPQDPNSVGQKSHPLLASDLFQDWMSSNHRLTRGCALLWELAESSTGWTIGRARATTYNPRGRQPLGKQHEHWLLCWDLVDQGHKWQCGL